MPREWKKNGGVEELTDDLIFKYTDSIIANWEKTIPKGNWSAFLNSCGGVSSDCGMCTAPLFREKYKEVFKKHNPKSFHEGGRRRIKRKSSVKKRVGRRNSSYKKRRMTKK